MKKRSDVHGGEGGDFFFMNFGTKTKGTIDTPGKFNILNPKNGGLVQIIFLFNWVIFRFHVDFKGCIWMFNS